MCRRRARPEQGQFGDPDRRSQVLSLLGRMFEAGHSFRSRLSYSDYAITGRPGDRLMSSGPPLNRVGLRLPCNAIGVLKEHGIFAQSSVSLEHQHLAKCYVICGVESGGAAGDVGHYVTFAHENGQPLDVFGRCASQALAEIDQSGAKTGHDKRPPVRPEAQSRPERSAQTSWLQPASFSVRRLPVVTICYPLQTKYRSCSLIIFNLPRVTPTVQKTRVVGLNKIKAD